MNISRLLSFLIVGLSLLSTLPAAAQTQAPIYWYFGNSGEGFRFIRPDYTAESTTIPNGLQQGMSGVATDPATGVLLFYTDGQTVYNGENNVMPNGTALNGSPAINQGVAVATNPANPDQYFIFTNNGNIEVSTVDMTLDQANPEALPRGEVITKNQAIPGLGGTFDPGMIILPKDSRDGFWLILHPTGGGTDFQVVDISNTGFTVQPLATVTSAPTVVDNFSYNPATARLAISAQNNEETAVVDFSTDTGLIGAFALPIPGSETTTKGYNIYDTEWSNNGQYLYLSGNFGNAQDELMQVDLLETPLQMRPVGTQNVDGSFGLQMAPDSSIYHLYQHTNGTFRSGRIEDADTTASQVRYVPNAFGPVNYQSRQYPSFLPPFDPMQMLSFEVAGICASVPSIFLPTIMPSADSVRWDFGDGNGSIELAPLYTYQQGGTYQVGLTAFLNGDSTTVFQNINITQFDLSISGFPDSDTVCAEDFPVQYTAEAQSQGAPPTFRWSNQIIDGPTTTVDSAGNYYVTATDQATGCVAYQALRVVEYRAIQQRAFIWYFGQNAGIDFNPLVDADNPGPARPIPFGDPSIFFGGSRMTAPEGCAIYCDDNGQPLFYSDGVDIFDRQGNLMATDIGGSRNSTQSVFILEFPSDATQFYVFLTREVYDPSGSMSYELNYVIFDLKQNDGLGDLVRDAANQVIVTKLFSRSTERITGTTNWLIAHEWGNNNFRAYPVNGNGIAPAVISNVGSVHSANTNTTAQGYMKLAPTGKLAVAVSQSNTENYVELFDFDQTTGAITNPLRLDLDNETGQVYGVEFSSDYRKIFATIRNPNGGGPSKIYRWQIDTTTVVDTETDPSFIIASKDLVADEAGEDLGALQLGPDGQIYVARDGSVNLALITNPNADLTMTPIPDAGYQLDGFGLGEDLVNGGFTLSSIGLPNFSSQFSTSTQEILLEVNSGCIGETLQFNVQNSQSLETYRWTIFDSDSIIVATGVGETFEFSSMTPGVYDARVDVIPDCQIVESLPLPGEATFEIYGDPVVTLANVIDPSSCGGEDGSITVEITENGFFAFEFSGPISFVSDTLAGPVSEVVDNLPSGTYNIYAINTVTGCQGDASVTLNDTGVRYDLNALPANADCDGENGSVTVSLIPNTGYTIGYPVNYVLRLEGSNNGVITGTYDNADGLQRFVASGLLEGVYNLEVSETMGDGCTQTLANIVIDAPPAAVLDVPSEVVACDELEAIIPFTTDAPGLQILEPIPGDFQLVNGELTVFAPGTWILETTETASLCPTTESVEVIFATSDPLPPTIEQTYTICPEDPVEENRSAVIDPGNAVFASIEYFDAEGAPITGTGPDYSLVGNILTVFVPGPVQIEVTNAFGCVTRETVDVIVDCQARLTAPDAFRPNSPIGDNAVWKLYPFLVSPDGFQLFIFNRWGEMIAQSRDLNFEWNGGYNNEEGRPVPGGTYAYRVIYESINDTGEGPQEARGAIILIR